MRKIIVNFFFIFLFLGNFVSILCFNKLNYNLIPIRTQDIRNFYTPEHAQDLDEVYADYTLLAEINDPFLYYKFIFLKDQYAYLDDGYGNLKIFDVSNPSNPQRVGQLDNIAKIIDIFVQEDTMFIATSWSGIIILDITDPTNPFEIIRLYEDKTITDFLIQNKLVFLLTENNGLYIFDISDLYQPVELSNYNVGSDFQQILIYNDYAFISQSNDYLIILNISDPQNISLIDTLEEINEVDTMVLYSNYLYICHENIYYIEIPDIGDNFNLILTPWTDAFYLPFEMQVAYDMLILRNDNDFYLFDLTIPTDIEYLGKIDLGVRIESFVFNEDIIYIAHSFEGFRTYGKDSDGDLVSDYEETTIFYTDPNNVDSDEDGLSDYEEIFMYSTNPWVEDSDEDELTDFDEVNLYSTDPTKWDTDNDNLSDGEEILIYYTNPNDNDSDGDGSYDGKDRFPNSILYPGVFVLMVSLGSFILICVGIRKLRHK